MHDAVDEVVSAAVHAVSSLFSNERIEVADRSARIKTIMQRVWQMLLSTDAETQVRAS